MRNISGNWTAPDAVILQRELKNALGDTVKGARGFDRKTFRAVMRSYQRRVAGRWDGNSDLTGLAASRLDEYPGLIVTPGVETPTDAELTAYGNMQLRLDAFKFKSLSKPQQRMLNNAYFDGSVTPRGAQIQTSESLRAMGLLEEVNDVLMVTSFGDAVMMREQANAAN